MSGPAPRAWTLDGERVSIQVDTSIYSIPAVLRAAYKLTDRTYFFHHREGDQLWATITAKDGQHLTQAVGEFTNELADQQVREILQKDFGPVQALIVAQAFSPTNLLDPARDDGDYRADPRGAGSRR